MSPKHLYDLFITCFDVNGLRQFLLFNVDDGTRVVNSIPSSGAPASVMFDAVQALTRRGLVDAALFQALAKQLPKRQPMIVETAQAMGIEFDLPAAAPARDHGPGVGGVRRDSANILFLGSDPLRAGGGPLELNLQLRLISDRIERSERRDHYKLISRMPVKTDEFAEYLDDHQPDVLHFAGHGSSTGGSAETNDENLIGLIVRDVNNQKIALSPEVFIEYMQEFGDSIRGVVLIACYTPLLAKKLVQRVSTIEWAVGVSGFFPAEAASQFGAPFYGALAKDKSVHFAFKSAAKTVKALAADAGDQLQLFVREGLDARQLRVP